MKDEPFNSFLYAEPGLLTLSSVYILTHKHRKHPLFGGGGEGLRGRAGSVPHTISDSVHGVETCMVKNLAPAPDQMPSLSLQRLGAMQICVTADTLLDLLSRCSWIPRQILLKVSFSEYANVSESIQSMMECFPFRILFLKRDRMAVRSSTTCANGCYSKEFLLLSLTCFKHQMRGSK